MKKLTIGMATYDDYDGMYFTIQSIRMYHSEIIDEIEFIIIDNNPYGKHAKAIKEFVKSISQPARYIPFSEYSSAFLKGKVFEYANTPYVLILDCHVLLEKGSIKKLINFFDAGKDCGNILHGPLLYDGLKNISTHFELKWRGQMWGTWATDKRGGDINGDPFEIPAQGMGLFSCRKDAWVGFNPRFRGFGGEEGYIHEKYRKFGKKAICLPFLRWVHRFGRPGGVPFRCVTQDRIKNYFIGFEELGLDTGPIYDHFVKDCKISEELVKKWHEEVKLESLRLMNLSEEDEKIKRNILFIGSGKSAKLIENLDLTKYTVVCLNNAWRLFENKNFDYWIRPNDFPIENYPKNKNYKREIRYEDYSFSMEHACKILNIQTKFPEQTLGYTSFFAGLYWIMVELKPKKISLLGFDHDYNTEKVKKWEKDNRPNIQNQFNKKTEKTIEDWASKYFDGMEKDFFYGHGTPDPLRLGVDVLISKFELAKINAKKFNINLVNLSPVISTINTIEKEEILLE